MKLPTSQQIKTLQHKLLTWYHKNGRHDLPWRKNPTPYRVLVSEIMLQQTQVSRVIPRYKNFLKLFPTIKSLASADSHTLLSAWSGLGYNRRALMLRQCAQVVVKHYKGRLPDSYEELLALPGIGPYTAHAINVFARNKNETCIDTNVRRVLTHELSLSPALSLSDLEIIALAAVPKNKSRDWHSALMDYGSTIATSRKTKIKPLGKPQSTFKDSDRYYRGRIVALLIERQHISTKQLSSQFNIPLSRLHKILDGMQQQRVIIKSRQIYKLPA